MNIIHKDAAVTGGGSDEDFPGTFEAILSAPTMDRDGETLLADGWKMPLPERITVDIDHAMTVAGTIGSAHPWLDDAGQLCISGTFASTPRAQEVRTLMNEGHINTTSVAYMSSKSTKDGKSTVTRELLNAAVVAIPSNREALVLSSKSGARNNASDATSIQSIHDSAATLGASCAAGKSLVAGTLKVALTGPGFVAAKSIVGSLEATQDRARDALKDAYPGCWVYLRATIPAGDGGTLVFGVEDRETYDSEEFRQSYTDDGSVVTLTGEPAAVDVMEVIAPDPDEDATDSATDGVTAAAAKAAAAITKTAAVDAADSDAVTARGLEIAIAVRAAQFI